MTWARGRSPRAPLPSAHAPRGRDSALLARSASLSERTFLGSESAASALRHCAAPARRRLCASKLRPPAAELLQA